MGNRKNKKGSFARIRHSKRNKPYTPSDHFDKENGTSKMKQQDAPEISKVSGTNSKQLSSQPRRVLLPTPSLARNVYPLSSQTRNVLPISPSARNLSDRIVKPPPYIHGIQQIQNDQRMHFNRCFGRSPVTFGETSSKINFQNPLMYDFPQASFNFAEMYAGLVRFPFRSVAVVAPNNLISKNIALNQSSGTHSGTVISKNGYYFTQRNVNRYKRGNLIAPPTKSSAASTRPTFEKNKNIEDDSDDVMYLYSVDTTPNGCIVEEVDLSTESVTVDLTAKRNSTEMLNLRQKTEISNVPAQKPETVISSNSSTRAKITSKQPKKSRKRKISENNENSNKRASMDPFQPRCSVCKVHYDELTKTFEHMFIATGCGHLFCHPCVRKSKKNCDICGMKILSYRKVFL